MFRRMGKNHEKENGSSIFKEENSSLYGSKKSEADIPPRLFDLPTPYMSEENRSEKTFSQPFQPVLKEDVPETTLGEGVTFLGQLSFEKLLRIDGTFEGELLSQGKIIVGPKGKVKADIQMREAIIEGIVEGNIFVQERLELRRSASVAGDIKAKSLIVDEGVSIKGLVEVSPVTLDA